MTLHREKWEQLLIELCKENNSSLITLSKDKYKRAYIKVKTKEKYKSNNYVRLSRSLGVSFEKRNFKKILYLIKEARIEHNQVLLTGEELCPFCKQKKLF
tara:strand:- start:294 stop:593 length:300 start_codon:yes stop_codon:yes gene_type:complete